MGAAAAQFPHEVGTVLIAARFACREKNVHPYGLALAAESVH
jgi:hypothetical protein